MRVHAHSHQYSEIVNFVQEFFHTNHQTYSQSAWEALVEGARNGNTGNSLFMNERTTFPSYPCTIFSTASPATVSQAVL